MLYIIKPITCFDNYKSIKILGRLVLVVLA